MSYQMVIAWKRFRYFDQIVHVSILTNSFCRLANHQSILFWALIYFGLRAFIESFELTEIIVYLFR